MQSRKLIITIEHALVGWALCAATLSLGKAVAPLQTALTVHALAAPIFFILVSLVYFTRFKDATPGQTALIFAAVMIGADVLIVALLINRNLEMFTDLPGTWIPYASILAATYLTGRCLAPIPAQTRGSYPAQQASK